MQSKFKIYYISTQIKLVKMFNLLIYSSILKFLLLEILIWRINSSTITNYTNLITREYWVWVKWVVLQSHMSHKISIIQFAIIVNAQSN